MRSAHADTLALRPPAEVHMHGWSSWFNQVINQLLMINFMKKIIKQTIECISCFEMGIAIKKILLKVDNLAKKSEKFKSW